MTRTKLHILALIIGVIAGLWYSAANAWEPTEFYKIDKRVEHPAVKVKAWRKLPRPIPKAEPVVRHVEPRCRNAIAAIGDSAKSEAAARLESQKAWKGVVQFELGNKFLDLNHAQDVTYQCGPSSVPKFGGLVESAVGKFLPIESITCRISAHPCAAPVQREEDGK